MSVDVMPDMTGFGGWEAADDVCSELLAATVDGTEVWLRCEVEGDHDEHEATLRWKTPAPEPPE